MVAGQWTFPTAVRTSILNGTFDFDSDSYKCALVTSASNVGAASTTWAGVTGEVAGANGYTTGGIALTISLSGTTTVVVDATANPQWNASGGTIVARWAVIYEVGGNVLCYGLLDNTPANITVVDGAYLRVVINGTGIFSLA